MRVVFNTWEEFLDELTLNPPKDRLVRHMFLAKKDQYGIRHVSVVASYLDGGHLIIEYAKYLGIQFSEEDHRKVKTLWEAQRQSLEQMGFTVRGGTYEP